MRLLLSVLLAAAAAALVSGTPGRASTYSPATVFSTFRGARVSLSVPRRSYPQNALVRAIISVRNTTKHTIWVYSGGPPMPDGFEPQVSLFDRFGQPVNTSVLDLFLWYPGPPPNPRPLRAGAQVRFPRYIVLRGPALETQVDVQNRAPGREAARRHTISTPRLHLALTSPDTPTVTITTTGGQPAAAIRYPDINAHSLRFLDSARCGPISDPTNVIENPIWVPVTKLDIMPGCVPIAWRVVVGTLNHSVAWIKYGPGA